MNDYMFRQACRPRGDFRIDEVIDFYYLMKEAFRLSTWYDENSKPVRITESVLKNIFEKEVDKQFPDIGVNVHFFSIPPRNRDDDTVCFEIHTGTHVGSIFIDSYDINIGPRPKLPNFDYFEKSIEIFKPFEAYLEEGENEEQLDAYNRGQAIPKFDRPAIIRGFHYLDESLARSIGGIKHCLKAPAWHVEEFCEGVLIELVPGPFDSENSEHMKVQRDVMDYFELL